MNTRETIRRNINNVFMARMKSLPVQDMDGDSKFISSTSSEYVADVVREELALILQLDRRAQRAMQTLQDQGVI